MSGLLSTIWANKEKYKVSLTFARHHSKIHLQHRATQPVHKRVNTIVLLLGDSGIGKSSICRAIAQDLGVRYCRWDAGAQLFDDNLGIPDPEGKVVTNSDGTTKKVTVNMEAELLPLFENEPLVLELSELPTAHTNVLQQIRQIIDGMFTNKPVSQNCMLIATGNPPTANYTTVSTAMCESIEERLHPYVVVPETAELFGVWSTMMEPVIYQFLLKHEMFVSVLSPRAWIDLAETVQALHNAQINPMQIYRDVVPKLYRNEMVGPPLLKYLTSGYQPDKVPILGREFLAADDKQLEVYLRRISNWFASNERGFIGATQLDLARVLMNYDTCGDGKHQKIDAIYPNVGINFTALVELFVKNNAPDMAASLIDAMYHGNITAVGAPIISVFKKSKSLVELGKKYQQFIRDYAEVITS